MADLGAIRAPISASMGEAQPFEHVWLFGVAGAMPSSLPSTRWIRVSWKRAGATPSSSGNAVRENRRMADSLEPGATQR